MVLDYVCIGLVLHVHVHPVQLLFGQHWILFKWGLVLVWFGIPFGLLGFLLDLAGLSLVVFFEELGRACPHHHHWHAVFFVLGAMAWEGPPDGHACSCIEMPHDAHMMPS